MSCSDHKITQFQHKIADLPDQPTLPPDELKSRFDACPEELRQSLNAVCDDAARLEARVEGIVVDTFGDTIDKEMLSDELAAELDGKATQSALDSTADALDERLDAVETALPVKCEVQIGSYVGTGSDNRFIDLGRTPIAVLLCDELSRIMDNGDAYGGLALTALSTRGLSITEGGFIAYNSDAKRAHCNHSSNGYGTKYHYLAFFCAV